MKLKLRFARCEMQGTSTTTKVGAGLWKMQPFHSWILAQETPSSEFSTATEVHTHSHRCLGFEARGENLRGNLKIIEEL